MVKNGLTILNRKNVKVRTEIKKELKRMKTKIISATIFILVGQIVALIIWKFFNENYFIHMLTASTVGFLAGYRGGKKIKL